MVGQYRYLILFKKINQSKQNLKGMNNLIIYTQNASDESFINSYNWLVSCIRKRDQKGKLVLVEHLAQCSTVNKMTQLVCRYAAKYGERFTNEEKSEARTFLAERIIEEARFE